ncbi:MAG: hypothetical protein Q9190_007653, partial [Brigantiaea leucoxantha]
MSTEPVYTFHPTDSRYFPLIGGQRPDDREILQLTIRLSQPHPDAEPEPDPQLNYTLLNALVHLCSSVLTTRDLKCFDYIVQSRQHYYMGHQKFHLTYRELQDCEAYSIILDRQKQEILDKGFPWDENKLQEIDRQHQLNDADMQMLVKKVLDCAKVRDQATAWFSDAKVGFVRSEMPRLLFCAEHMRSKQFSGMEGAY